MVARIGARRGARAAARTAGVAAVVAAVVAALAGCGTTVNGTGTASGAPAATRGDFPSTAVPTAPGTTPGPATSAAPTSAPPAPTGTGAPRTAPASGVSSPPNDGAGQKPYLAKFVGQWIGHGRELVIRADGSASMIYRTYRNCSDNPTPPCDKIIDNQIEAGGRMTLTVLQTITDSGNYGALVRVDSTNDPAFKKDQQGGISLDKTDVITVDFFYSSTFCGPKAPSGACGA